MSFTDPVGDLITRVRNAIAARHDKVVIPASKLKARIVELLRDEGYIKDYVLHKDDYGKQGAITVILKYMPESAITEMKRVSTPGLRRYVPSKEIPRVLNGHGIAILSTSKGVMCDREARKQKVGGELICTVW